MAGQPGILYEIDMVDRLRDAAHSGRLPVGADVRGAYDVSPPNAGEWGVVVAAGAARQLFDRAPGVVDCDITVTIYTHLDEDEDGSVHRAMAGVVLDALAGYNAQVGGWHLAMPLVLEPGLLAMDGVYRSQVWSGVLHCNFSADNTED